MSAEEMIAELESRKVDAIDMFDRAIRHHQSPSAETLTVETGEAPPVRPGSRFHPIPSTGTPASEMILHDRG